MISTKNVAIKMVVPRAIYTHTPYTYVCINACVIFE